MALILIVAHPSESYQPIVVALQNAGFATSLVYGTEEALVHVQDDLPALILLEWSPAESESRRLLLELRNQILDDLPVLAIGHGREPSEFVDCLSAGADGFLVRPVRSEELLAYVSALLRRTARFKAALNPGSNQSRLLYHRDLILDPASYSARLGEAHLNLTRSEFKLLALLMNVPGRLYSRADVMRILWHDYHIPGDRSVDNIVLRLRRKLGEYGDDVETVRGIGYRLRRAQTPMT